MFRFLTKCFVKIGKGLLYVFLFLACVGTFILVFEYIGEVWKIEDEARVQSQRDKGFLPMLPAIQKKHPKMKDCVIRDESIICEYHEGGVLKAGEFTK
jgi:hypothetical protein